MVTTSDWILCFISAMDTYISGFLQLQYSLLLAGFWSLRVCFDPGTSSISRPVEFFVYFLALSASYLLRCLCSGQSSRSFRSREYFTDFQFYRYAKNIVTLTVDHLPGVTSGDGHAIDVNGSLWTLHFEVLSYAALAITSILGILHRRSLFLALFLISYGTNIVLGLDPAFSALLPARFVTFMSLFVYFMTGAMFFVYADHIPYSPILAIGILALAVVTMPFGLGALFVPVCLSYLMVFLGLSALPGHSYLKRDLSYGVYLIHAPVIVVITVYFPGFRVWWLVAVMVLSVTLVFAYLSWTYVEGPAMSHKKIVADWINQRANALWLLRPKAVANDQNLAPHN